MYLVRFDVVRSGHHESAYHICSHYKYVECMSSIFSFVPLPIVTAPPGLYPGDPMTVATPDGQYLSVTVPEGMCGGSTFLVEFVSGPPPMSSDNIKEQSLKTDDDDLPVAIPVPTS